LDRFSHNPGATVEQHCQRYYQDGQADSIFLPGFHYVILHFQIPWILAQAGAWGYRFNLVADNG
jgi:hypothetical protein